MRTLHVGVNCRIVEHGVNWVIFDLVHKDWLINKRSEQFDLRWRMVADPEFSNFACSLQTIESLSNLLRLDKRVGSMQKQDVQVVGTQPLQASLNRLDNVVKNQFESTPEP